VNEPSRLGQLCEAVRTIGSTTDQVASALQHQAAQLRRIAARAASATNRSTPSGVTASIAAFQSAADSCIRAANALTTAGKSARDFAGATCGGSGSPGRSLGQAATWPFPVTADSAGFAVSPQRREHVLTGNPHNVHDGGHLFGTGRNKTLFPERWNAQTVMEMVADVARRPDAPPHLQRSQKGPPRWIAEGTRDDVAVYVVLELDGRLVTAFPLHGRGVVDNRD